MNDFHQALIELLITQKSITSQEAKNIMAEFDVSEIENLDDFLINEGLVDEFDLLRALGTYYQVPTCDVLGLFVDRHLVRKFPKEFLVRNCILPIEVDGNIIIIVTANPNDESLLEKIGNYVSYDVQFQVGIGGDIIDAIEEYYDESDTEMQDLVFNPDRVDLHYHKLDMIVDDLEEEIEEELRPD